MIDDLPVGGGGGSSKNNDAAGGPGFGDEDSGPKQIATADHSAPIEQRLVSKNWQVRAKAYEDLSDMFKSTKNPQDDVFRDHSGSWKKYLNDNNPGSLEKCIDSMQVFIDKADPKIIQQT
jgi:hypothetical protein